MSTLLLVAPVDPSLLAWPCAALAAALGSWLQLAFPPGDPALEAALLGAAGVP